MMYSVLGSSKHLAVGPVSIASLVMGTMLTEAVPYNQDPVLYLKLAFTATFFAGVFQATLGLLRRQQCARERGRTCWRGGGLWDEHSGEGAEKRLHVGFAHEEVLEWVA
ncbi:hypothetical protein E3N88_39566 [Mikania micrantha]|uniref:SLC26A/SulP transporter domain-containing protein n=1 Tax=Mikania micrantha TaxID=192012 RepID=A0A5N6LX44_9ASTR|nr:hypothetical protein E3N88_39566 [Mikania micrantha]